jgi:hypothetical protein
MPGLVPGIHVFGDLRAISVDGRAKPGHDDSIRNHELATGRGWKLPRNLRGRQVEFERHGRIVAADEGAPAIGAKPEAHGGFRR